VDEKVRQLMAQINVLEDDRMPRATHLHHEFCRPSRTRCLALARLVRSLFYCRCRMNGCQQAFPASGSPCRQQPFTPFLPDRVSGETQPPA
jgi:hypothetical protein